MKSAHREICIFQDIFKDAIESNLGSATEVPYFEGDFWPNVIEESIKELHQEEEEKRKREEAEAAAAEAEAALDTVEETTETVGATFLYVLGGNMVVCGGLYFGNDVMKIFVDARCSSCRSDWKGIL